MIEEININEEKSRCLKPSAQLSLKFIAENLTFIKIQKIYYKDLLQDIKHCNYI